LLKVIALVIAIYLVIAVISFFSGSATLLAFPLIPVFWAIERVRRPPSFRLRMGLRDLKSEFGRRSPAIIDARVDPWTSDPLRVSLVCRLDAERSALATQLSDLRARIAIAAIERGVSPELSRRIEVQAVSREEIDREGGWWGFDHNVPWRADHDR